MKLTVLTRKRLSSGVDFLFKERQMKSKIKILFKWVWLNFQFFIPFFWLVWGLIVLFPHTMLRIFGQWAFLIKMTGAQNLNEFPSPLAIFTHILTRNGITAICHSSIVRAVASW
jgi:hypothetical protein